MDKDLTLTSIETITAYSLAGVHKFTLDELQNAKIANTQEKADITGKGGRKLNSLKKNKSVVISGTNGLVSSGLLETQTGGAFVRKESTPVNWIDYKVINNDAAITEFKAVGTVGAEIEALYVKNADGTLGDRLEQAGTAAAGKYTYTIGTKALAFNTGDYVNGTEIVVYYTRNILGDVLENSSDKHSDKLTLYIDAFGEDKCSNLYRVQFYIPRADFSGDFELDIGDNQTVHAFEAESLSGSCGGNSSLWTYTVFGANAADAA